MKSGWVRRKMALITPARQEWAFVVIRTLALIVYSVCLVEVGQAIIRMSIMRCNSRALFLFPRRAVMFHSRYQSKSSLKYSLYLPLSLSLHPSLFLISIAL